MLGPHHREDAEFDEVRLAAERFQDAIIFIGRETVLGDHFGRDAGASRTSMRGPLAAAPRGG